MKVFVILASIGLVLAKDFKMEINEGRKFIEEVKIDEAAGTEEIKVPAHLDRVAVDVLNDFTTGYSAHKVETLKTCHIRVIDRTTETPGQMEKSMEVSHAKFKKARYMVVDEKTLPVRRMSEEEVGKKIAAHCKGYKLILVRIFVDDDESAINAYATSLVRESLKTSRSKRAVLQDFTACNTASTNIIGSCSPFSRIAASCRFRRNDGKTCIYKVTCKQTATGFDCTDSHFRNSLTCCDYVCK